MRSPFGSLRSRILILILATSLLPLGILTVILSREAAQLVTLWQPTRLGRSLSASLEAQRELLEAQGEIQGRLARRLDSGEAAEADAAGFEVVRRTVTLGGDTAPPAPARETARHTPAPISPEDQIWLRAAPRLPEDRPGAEGPEPPYRLLSLPGDRSDLLVAAARTLNRAAGTIDWVLVAHSFPPATFDRLESLGRDAAFLNRLQEITAVAGTALGLMILFAAAATGLAAALVALFLSRSITRPVEELAIAMSELGRGRDLPRIRPRGAREVRLLGETFNRLLDQLRQAQARLAARQRSLGFRDSARHVAHETKNALTPILSAIGVLKGHVAAGDDRPRRALELLEGEAGRLQRLATAFSQMGRLPTPEPQAVDPVASLERVLQLHLPSSVSLVSDSSAAAVSDSREPPGRDPSAPAGRDPHVSSVSDSSAGAQRDPSARAGSDEAPMVASRTASDPAARRVLIDPGALEQVWINLVRNAAEAMPDRGSLRISWWCEGGAGEERRVAVSLTDSGSGLPPSAGEDLFRPGFTTKPQGSGLGLYITRLLLQSAGGEIKLEPDAGGGVRAVVRLPLMTGVDAASSDAKAHAQRPAAEETS
ncbi:MAG: HAMP domain-containing protein [Candidatus Eisenbacteria bacterium]|nr:HAMP domain-containing protein [Candidatus Eisenbacteria bacterium]